MEANRNFVTLVKVDPTTNVSSYGNSELSFNLTAKQVEKLNAGENLVGLVSDNLFRKCGLSLQSMRDECTNIFLAYEIAKDTAAEKTHKKADKLAAKEAEVLKGQIGFEYEDENDPAFLRKIQNEYDRVYESVYSDEYSPKLDTEIRRMYAGFSAVQKRIYNNLSMRHIKLVAEGKGNVLGIATDYQVDAILSMFPTLEFCILPLNMKLSDYVRAVILGEIEAGAAKQYAAI